MLPPCCAARKINDSPRIRDQLTLHGFPRSLPSSQAVLRSASLRIFSSRLSLAGGGRTTPPAAASELLESTLAAVRKKTAEGASTKEPGAGSTGKRDEVGECDRFALAKAVVVGRLTEASASRSSCAPAWKENAANITAACETTRRRKIEGPDVPDDVLFIYLMRSVRARASSADHHPDQTAMPRKW